MNTQFLVVSFFFVFLTLPSVFGFLPNNPPLHNITDAPAETCGGNCPSNDCKSCPCGTGTLSVNIAAACAAYTGWNQAHCQCIIQHESGGNAHAANQNTNGSFDVGIWQINSVNWASCNGGTAPCAEANNRQCAIDVWRSGGNSFRLWSTCRVCNAC